MPNLHRIWAGAIMNLKKMLNNKPDHKAFTHYETRNFWRSFARSMGGVGGRALFAQGAMADAHGKYEPFVMPAIERQLEALIARQVQGMNMLYPPGNYSMLGRKFRKSELTKAKNPVYWGYARIPFGKLRDRGSVPEYYRKQYISWNKKMTYTSYDFAPYRWMERCHDIILNQKDMEKSEKNRIRWNRKPWHERMPHSELTFLLAVIPACIHENLTFLDEIRAGDHTYMKHNPIVTVDMVRNASER